MKVVAAVVAEEYLALGIVGDSPAQMSRDR
jgi:hypothetical protein